MEDRTHEVTAAERHRADVKAEGERNRSCATSRANLQSVSTNDSIYLKSENQQPPPF